jgi:radical SAM-linked protein
MKIRMKYTKTGVLKYIGHLDMMRYFQKLLRRSGMDIGFTQGFSPHPELSIALPLGIGVTSEAEYMDVTINSCGHSSEMIALLNQDQVDGVRILSFKKIPDGRRSNCMAIVSAARYRVSLSAGFKESLKAGGIDIGGRLSDMLSQPEIIIRKKTKRSDMDSDIRPLVYEACLVKDAASWDCIELLLAAGSTNSLNPDTFMRAFAGYCDVEAEDIPWHIHRTEIYAGDKDALVSLDSLGEDV